jgi:hypothetical protein
MAVVDVVDNKKKNSGKKLRGWYVLVSEGDDIDVTWDGVTFLDKFGASLDRLDWFLGNQQRGWMYKTKYTKINRKSLSILYAGE